MEERCFKKFQDQYEILKKDLDNKGVPAEVKEILLQSCLDKWAFWLDKNSKRIKNAPDEQSKRNCNSLLGKFISRLNDLDTGYSEKPICGVSLITETAFTTTITTTEYDSNNWLAWVEGNPVQMVKLGKYLSQNNKHKNAYKNAIKLFNEVINEEPHFSEAAYYYKAFALVKIIDWEQKPFDKKLLKELKKALQEAVKLFEEHSKFSMCAASIIGKIKRNNNESIIQIDAYEKQQKSLANLYYMFSQSVADILGHLVTPQSFVNNDINESLVQDIYKALLKEGILKMPRVKTSISQEELKVISSGYGVLVQELKGFLSHYEGKYIYENDFKKALKKAIPLPSREAFWKLLIEKKVLSENVKYVVVDKERLKEINSTWLDFLTKKINEDKLKKQVLETNNEQILFNVESLTQQINNDYIFIKDDFIKIIRKVKYTILKENGVLSFNKKARVNLSKIESTILSNFDSITIKDFTNKANITESEAEKILVDLVERGVLEKDLKNNLYRLKVNYEEIDQHVQLPLCPVYVNAVKALIFACFTYRIVLQKIASQLKEKNAPVYLQLMTKPHQSLLFDLLEGQIIKPVIVSRKNKDLEKTVKEALNKLQLTQEDLIKNVIRTLERSKSSLKYLKVPDSSLKPFNELCSQCEFATIEEVHLFSLNGLDHLLLLGEKKWTREMIFNTAVVTAMGISQIAIGTVIELYSVGIMTHVGAAFINEGVSDLLFATGALKSGYFSWEDYGQHKLQSLMMTAVTVGVGAYFSRSAKVSRFGHKLAGPSFECSKKKVAEMSGKQLIKLKTAVSINVRKEVAKRITLKAVEGLAFGLANAGVDTLIENCLQGLCEDMVSSLLANIEQEVEKHNISASLKEIYELLGEEKAKKVMNNLTQSAFTEQNCIQKFLPVANKIASSVIQGIANAVEKRSITSNKLELPVNVISKVVIWVERIVHIGLVTTAASELLNDLDRQIKNKSNSNKLKGTGELIKKQEAEKVYDSFKKELVDQWKSLLSKKVGQVILQHIVSPILKQSSSCLIRYVGRKVQQVYRSYKESEYLEHFQKLKQEYEKEVQSKQQSCINGSTAKNHITEKYQKSLIKLMMKTRNPSLLANIVQENIPMDITCVSACPDVVCEVLKEKGFEIQGLTIIVEGDGGIRQKCSTKGGKEGIIIPLTLKDNHFEFCASNTSENNERSESENNCLYEALSEALPGLTNIITPEEFRSRVANRIEHDKEIRYHIQQGWHRFPISLGAFGGKQNTNMTTNKINDKAEKMSPYEHATWKLQSSTDVDLRKDIEQLSNNEITEQLAKANNEALKIMNQILSKICKEIKPKIKPVVGPGNFQATKVDKVLVRKSYGVVTVGYYPVEMDALITIVDDHGTIHEYKLRIDLDNPINSPTLQGPPGPHVGYHFKCKPEQIKVVGHILINQNNKLPDRARALSIGHSDSRMPRISTTRVFFKPNDPNTTLERTDAEYEHQIKKNEIRSRKYPSEDY